MSLDQETTTSAHTVLVLEDERPLLHAITQKLEQSGFTVLAARTVEEAFKRLETVSHVDAFWVDHYLLGKESGLDFVMKIKDDHSQWKDVPVFVVSNTASDEKVSAYMKLGIDKYYIKTDHRLDQIIMEIRSRIENQKGAV